MNIPASGTVTARERRWHWRTWNLLYQVRAATDGESPEQRSGETVGRGLCMSAGRSDVRAIVDRGWLESTDVGELFDDDGNSRVLPVWTITTSGRKALDEAVALGISVI